MLANMRFSKKLGLLVILLGAGVVSVGFVGARGIEGVWAGLKTVYEDRTVCLEQLSQINDDINEIRADFLLVEADGEKAEPAKRLEDISRQDDDLKKQWADYAGTYLVPEEKTLADQYSDAYKAFQQTEQKMVASLKDGRRDEYHSLLAGEFATAFDKASVPLSDLIHLQVRVAKEEYDKASATTALSKKLNIGITLGALFAGIVLGFVISRSITKPLTKMLLVMKTLADGNHRVDVPDTSRGDEVGDIAKSVQVFRDSAIAMEKLKGEQEAAKARAEHERRAMMLGLADSFDREVGGIVNSVTESANTLSGAATSLSSTAEETSRQSSTVAAAAEQASANVQTVAAAAEELSSSILEIGRQVGEASSISGQAVQEAKNTNGMVEKLAVSAQKIGDVVSLITEIASQTNLLALNATIEAARAGEAGKGFAVVASEVKGLATQTAKATEEIAGQIGAIQEETKATVKAIQNIGQIIEKVNGIASTIASAVEEQSSATKEISRNVQEASMGTSQVSSNIIGVNLAAESTGQSALIVSQSSTTLSAESDKLNQKVAVFLKSLREG